MPFQRIVTQATRLLPSLRVAILVAATAMLPGAGNAADSFALRSSLYYAALERDYAAGDEAEFRDVDGDTLARGSRAFLAAASIEGTAEFADGTVLNFHRMMAGEVRWQRVEARHGLDARGCALVPFRSAAVDPAVVPLGTQLRIAETLGMPLPDGSVHDGIWIATDTGEAILGDRIDLYTGRGMATMAPLERIGLDYLDPVEVQVTGRNLPCP